MLVTIEMRARVYGRACNWKVNMKQLYAILFTLILLTVSACSQANSTADGARGVTDAGLPKNRAGYADINVQQLAGMLPEKDFTMVNVHIPYEGELEQTDLFIPYNQIADHLEQLPAKDEPIVLYCRSGRMSAEAATELARLGYTNVMELNGGFIAWRAAGYELLHNP
jgi:rhodanese-related sulfurtransferase